MNSYAGKIAYINLTSGEIKLKDTPEDLKKNYIGARGFGVKIVSDMVSPGTDPLSEDNVIVFASGPLTGTKIPLGSRYNIITVSPLNGTLSSANSGGVFGWKMKKAGFDAVVISGKSKKPVYILLNEGNAEIRDASSCWGLTTSQTTAAIKKDLNDDSARISCIGPAGEKLIKISCIINEDSRAAGRGGSGAVMGSKNLKAVAAIGKIDIKTGDKEKFTEVKERLSAKMNENGILQALHSYGTPVLVNIINENYILPTKNFQTAHFPTAEKISGERMAETILKKPKGCYSCIIQCGRVCEFGDIKGEGPEYESTWGFGPDCGIDNLEKVAEASYICNDLGLDTISTASTIACAMEMSEKGYIKDKIKFGDADMMISLVKKMGRREGIGDELAEGSFAFASKYGHPELSMSVKKQELPAYDARGLQGHGLSYATSVRGGDHVYAYLISPEILGSPEKLDPYSSENKPFWVKTFQDLTAAIDSSGMCLFTSFAMGADDYAELMTLLSGISFTGADFMKAGERIWNLQKLFNVKAGYGKADDTLPKRLLEEPLKEGAPAGRVWERQPMLDEYYSLRGWDTEGIPTAEKLEELGLK